MPRLEGESVCVLHLLLIIRIESNRSAFKVHLGKTRRPPAAKWLL
jgi:hypothetical protein